MIHLILPTALSNATLGEVGGKSYLPPDEDDEMTIFLGQPSRPPQQTHGPEEIILIAPCGCRGKQLRRTSRHRNSRA